jgi:hypothetical protein
MLPELALTNLRDDIVIRSLGGEAPVRHVGAVTLAGRLPLPAMEAMLEALRQAAVQYRARARQAA